MSVVFNLLLHVLLLGSLLMFVAMTVMGAIGEPDPREKIVRILALAGGAMVALGADAAGVSYADYIVSTLAGARAASAGAAAVTTLIPALLGVGLGFYLVRTFERSSKIGTRLLGFLAILTSVAFLTIYTEATTANGIFLGSAALPNIGFLTGVILTIIFTWDPDAAPSTSRWAAILSVFGRKPTPSPAASAPTPRRSVRRDPYENV